MATTLGAMTVGSTVKIKVDGTAQEFIIIHQGRPSTLYDTGFDGGTILLRNDLLFQPWDETNTADYANSTVHNWLNSTYFNRIEAIVSKHIKGVKIPYRPGSEPSTIVKSGKDGLAAKVFLLSGREVGWTQEDEIFTPDDGVKLNYFDSGTGTIANSKRVVPKYADVVNTHWWTRSPRTTSATNAYRVTAAGGLGMATCMTPSGIRPAIVLPSTLRVMDDGTVIANTAPTVPPSITIPNTIHGDTSFSISWEAAGDDDGNLSGYKLERSLNGGTWTQIFQAKALTMTDTVAFGTNTVAYRVKAYDNYGEESAYQTSPTRTVINNVAPGVPPNLSVPANLMGGKTCTVSWGRSADSDGNLAGYRLERSVNGATFTQIYQGEALFYTDTITKDWSTVAYRVKAYDTIGTESGYATSPTRTVDNSTAPEISTATPGYLGTKSEGFSWSYRVNQAENQPTTVTETMDGVTIRSYTAVLGQENIFDVTGAYFQKLLNGTRTMMVTATAGDKTTTYIVTFTKAVYALDITMTAPLVVDSPITKLVMNVERSMPTDAGFKVMASNNAADPSPVWEDVTAAVICGTNYLFSNTTVATNPAFNFRITASRGASNTGGFISSIGGAFE